MKRHETERPEGSFIDLDISGETVRVSLESIGREEILGVGGIEIYFKTDEGDDDGKETSYGVSQSDDVIDAGIKDLESRGYTTSAVIPWGVDSTFRGMLPVHCNGFLSIGCRRRYFKSDLLATWLTVLAREFRRLVNVDGAPLRSFDVDDKAPMMPWGEVAASMRAAAVDYHDDMSGQSALFAPGRLRLPDPSPVAVSPTPTSKKTRTKKGPKK